MNFTEEPRDFNPSYALLAEETKDDLDELHARARTEMESWKRSVMEWLIFEGKEPDKFEGYASETLRGTNYKIHQIMRWLWNQRGYTTELTPDDADALMRELARYTEYSNANLNNFVKALKRIFKFYNHEKGRKSRGTAR